MTLDEALTKAGRELDAMIAERVDKSLELMVSCGVDPDLAADMLDEERSRLAAWRVTVLDSLRAALLPDSSGR